MKILKNTKDLNLMLNVETDFLQNLGSDDSLIQFEGEVLKDIINPIENYENIRYIHKPYTGVTSNTGDTQCDIWFYFYFLSGTTYVQDYTPQGISSIENELMLKQSTESFFRLEFYKTPGTVTNNVLKCEAPTRINRKLAFSRNLSLPLGEKMFYNTLNGYVHVPVFSGNNYRNKENMYLYWFEDESVLEETNLSGSTTGNTFFMTAKFYNAKEGTIIDFANNIFSTSYSSTGFTESSDMYFQVDIDKTNHTYVISRFTGTTGTTVTSRVGTVSGSTLSTPITFYEKGGGTLPTPPTTPPVTPTRTPVSTPAASSAGPLVTPTRTQTMTPTMSTDFYWFALYRCDDGTQCFSIPKSMAQMAPGRIFYSAGGHYYTIGDYYNTTGADPGLGTGGCNSKLDGSMMPAGYTCYDSPETPIPSPNPSRVGYFIQTGTTQQVNDWCTAKAYPTDTLGGHTVYITYTLAPLTPPTTYTIYKNSPDGDSQLFYVPAAGHESEYVPFVLFGTNPTRVAWKGSISPSSVIQDWSQCL